MRRTSLTTTSKSIFKCKIILIIINETKLINFSYCVRRSIEIEKDIKIVFEVRKNLGSQDYVCAIFSWFTQNTIWTIKKTFLYVGDLNRWAFDDMSIWTCWAVVAAAIVRGLPCRYHQWSWRFMDRCWNSVLAFMMMIVFAAYAVCSASTAIGLCCSGRCVAVVAGPTNRTFKRLFSRFLLLKFSIELNKWN